jgi:hypothetical protein
VDVLDVHKPNNGSSGSPEQAGLHAREEVELHFLIHLDTVVRETPNVRIRPCKLLRS